MSKRFHVIVVDPPWEFDDTLTMSKVKRGAKSQYKGVLTAEDIRRLRVQAVAADDAVLVLWTTSGHLRAAFEVMETWGFEYKQTWVWVKTGKNEKRLLRAHHNSKLAFGMGHLGRNCHELMLVGICGNIYRMRRNRAQRTVFLAPKQHLTLHDGREVSHSVKPESIQDALERIFPEANCLEIFARRQRNGWTCIGNEAPATYGEDVRKSLRKLRCKKQLRAVKKVEVRTTCS